MLASTGPLYSLPDRPALLLTGLDRSTPYLTGPLYSLPDRTTPYRTGPLYSLPDIISMRRVEAMTRRCHRSHPADLLLIQLRK
ncbi:hypothetical protein FQA47_025511 [Oryzias melastigma]|uniref:Uncharacterized protein n=1 Tax=Oryzias melastigma TaxID=30732 RepID=A0A834FNR8_ORYME|nr:hypothetical protein FQA47_025511 [Oryzias melastigma]